MFEDINFDLDDDAILGTSFTPITGSTQTSSQQKRHSQEIDKENLKRLKLCDSHSSFSETDNLVSPSKKSQKIVEVSVNTPNRVVKRKFPGPAGLLPERSESNTSILDLISNEGYKQDDTQDMLLCSQRTVSVFEDGPWKEMTKDFCVPNRECPYKKYNIAWIKRQASLKKLLVNHKAPFLAAVIQSLEIFDGKVPTVNVTLKDATGNIQSTVLHSLYEEYSNFFTTGSVLVLKQFGVLTAGLNNHCLTITPNNLVTIYCLEVPKMILNGGVTSSCANGCNVKKVVIQECNVDEVMKKYDEDVLAGVQKEKGINFGKIYQNHGNLLRSGSSGDNQSMLFNNRIQGSSIQPQRNDFITPKFKNNFNNCGNINSSILLEVSAKPLPSEDTSKTKFNFKRVGSGAKETQSKCVDLNVVNEDKKISSVDTNCDIVLSGSRSSISVKPDNKEDTEIWRKLLEDVDTDALFDEF